MRSIRQSHFANQWHDRWGNSRIASRYSLTNYYTNLGVETAKRSQCFCNRERPYTAIFAYRIQSVGLVGLYCSHTIAWRQGHAWQSFHIHMHRTMVMVTIPKEDQKMQQDALVGNQIVNPSLPPRHVWDLYSNRVVPWWSGRGITIHKESVYKRGTIRSEPCPILHAWLDTKDHVYVQTPIHGYGWPVTIPKDADLNLIHIEMLNLGMEYTWLDVFCLRQVGGPGKDMHIEEWKLDVPIIGAVYTSVNVVWYLSGLGQPLSLKKGDLDSDWSWFQRAWTLQEIGHAKSRMIAGDMPNGPLHAKPIDVDGNYETELLTRFHK